MKPGKSNIYSRLLEFNKDIPPTLKGLKFQALLESPMRFFRGTCHLFYEDMPTDSFLLKSPNVWLCGDLHLENFGSFKGVYRLYFDVNDFDEAFLGPCLIDIVRLCSSIYLISDSINFTKEDCRKLISALLLSYSETLQEGEAYFLEHQTAAGFLKKFLDNVSCHTQQEFLANKVKRKGKVRLKCDNIKSFKTDRPTKKMVKNALAKWVEINCADPKFFKVKDIVFRASGTGSIRGERYMLLVAGNKNEPDTLLDIKEATPTPALQYLKIKQPKWHSEAERIIAVQRRVQAALPIFFSEITMNGKKFIIKEKQADESKVHYKYLANDVENFVQLMHDIGALLAWNSLRSGGRQGSAIADDLIRFGKRVADLEPEIVQYAENYAAVTVKYWNEFKKQYSKENYIKGLTVKK